MATPTLTLTLTEYLKTAGINDAFPQLKFVVTKGYNNLKMMKHSKMSNTTIIGPKGVGKSMSLLAYWNEVHTNHPCIIITAKSISSSSFIPVLREICDQWGK